MARNTIKVATPNRRVAVELQIQAGIQEIHRAIVDLVDQTDGGRTIRIAKYCTRIATDTLRKRLSIGWAGAAEPLEDCETTAGPRIEQCLLRIT